MFNKPSYRDHSPGPIKIIFNLIGWVFAAILYGILSIVGIL